MSGKFWNTDRNNVEAACCQTIHNLKCNYLDLYLVHWPASKAVHEDWAEVNAQVWKQMESLVSSGKNRYIGVSNFKVNQLEELLSGCSVKPFVNQIEYHPGTTELAQTGSLSIVGINPKKQNKRTRQAMAEKLSLV